MGPLAEHCPGKPCRIIDICICIDTMYMYMFIYICINHAVHMYVYKHPGNSCRQCATFLSFGGRVWQSWVEFFKWEKALASENPRGMDCSREKLP